MLDNIIQYATTRYTTKAFDPTKTIEPDLFEQLMTVLRYSPSSTNAQPWHFIVTNTPEGKAQMAQSTEQFAYNTLKLTQASHVIALCARLDLEDAYLENLLAQESRDGRFPNEAAQTRQKETRQFYVTLHKKDPQDFAAWINQQIYLSLGALLISARTLGIDTCTMEGFDPDTLSEVLQLKEKGLRPVVLVALGYRATDDFNAKLPKSRWPQEDLFTWI